MNFRFNSARKLIRLLDRGQQKQAGVLLGLMLVGMMFEALGVSLVVPAVAIFANPELIEKNQFVSSVIGDWLPPDQATMIIYGAVALVGLFLVKSLFLSFLAYVQVRFTHQVMREMSARLFSKYLRQPYTFHLERNSAQLVRNVTSEVWTFCNNGIKPLMNLVSEGLVLFGLGALLLIVEPFATGLVMVSIAVVAGVYHFATVRMIERWGETRLFHDGMRFQHVQQGLGGVKDVILLGREADFLNQFEKHNISSTQVTQKYQTLVLMPRLWLEFLGVASLAVIMVLMTLNGKNPSEMLATMGLICAAAFRMLPSANRVVNAVQQLSYGLAVVDTLASELALNGLQKGEASLECEFLDSLQARSLSFRYENIDRLALDSVSFSLKKGESLGIVGASGSGKSTLVDVLLGLLTPSAGKLLIDGKCYASAIGAWQRLIGYVPQSIYLTDDTLRRNIAFGIEEEAIEEKAVTEALKAAQLLEFVQELPEGLETRVGERGIRLSGGQRQRIGIARALYHDPDVLVLDEATSALDANTEKGVMSAVSALQGRKTIIIIAHRLSTVEQCDVLMRMEAGKVISKGSYIQVINSGSKNIESDKLINRK